MKGSEAVKSKSIPEYWAIKPGFEEEIKKIINERPEPEISLDYEIAENDYVKTGKASSDVKFFLKKLGVNPEVLRRVAVASYEAEINVTAHSKGGKVTANIYSDYIIMMFEDYGPGIADIEQAMQPGFSTANELAREMGFGAGLGLPNIKKNCDGMYLSSEPGGSTTLIFFIYYEEKSYAAK
ncbi:MAG: ATP-binding protein [Candidatus Cloacimonas sp.]|nr:ATP-binding protein [Candidatus Cloacimonadota bacterium]